jgi:hypothetical protein
VTVLAWVAAGVLLVLVLLAAAATRRPALERPTRIGVVVAEVVAVLVVVVDLGLILGAEPGDRPASLVTHLGYALAAVGLVPALLWRPPSPDDAGTEPEPVSPWVVVVVLAAVAVCLVRLAQTR